MWRAAIKLEQMAKQIQAADFYQSWYPELKIGETMAKIKERQIQNADNVIRDARDIVHAMVSKAPGSEDQTSREGKLRSES